MSVCPPCFEASRKRTPPAADLPGHRIVSAPHMTLPVLPTLRSSFRMAVVALASCLWTASCAPDSGGAFFQDLSSPLTASPQRPRTLLVHIPYGSAENLSRLSEDLDLLEHAD